jgi:Fe-S cluster biogenesis protein NfuA
MDVREHQSQAARIEALLQEVAAFPDPQGRSTMEELLRALLDMYGEGLAHMLEITARAEESGQTLIERFACDELVGSLLLLHGLHPVDLETRIHQILEKLQPSVRSQGGMVEFVRLEAGTLFLRLTDGGCHSCQSSGEALRRMVEEAVANAAPDLDEIRIEGTATSRQAAIPVKFVPRRQRRERCSI